MSSSRVLASFTLVLGLTLSTTALRAASDDGARPDAPKPPNSILEMRIPIPHEPDAANNGCRLRSSPAQRETGALTEVPFWNLIERVNLRYSVRLTVDGPEKFAALIAPLGEDERTLAALYALWDHLGRDGLHTFFYSERAGALAPLIRDALKQAGLGREADIFNRAMALFGKDYPVDAEQRARFFGWSRPSTRVDAVTTIPAPLNAFDYRLMALAKEFGNRHAFAGTITAFIESRPSLWQRIGAQRIALNEPDRLAILTAALSEQLGNLWRPYPEIDKRLVSLTPPQRALAVMTAFNDEFRDGGVHQFFYNPTGALAPEVRDAMIELGLTAQAALLQRGLEMFGKPYLRDTARRREVNFGHDGWTHWDKRLSALTDAFYALDGGLEFHQIKGSMVVEGGPGIDFAMLNYARHAGLLPC